MKLLLDIKLSAAVEHLAVEAKELSPYFEEELSELFSEFLRKHPALEQAIGEAAEAVLTNFDELYGDGPDEAQEWADYDPDC